jgi:hypothetical protein
MRRTDGTSRSRSSNHSCSTDLRQTNLLLSEREPMGNASSAPVEVLATPFSDTSLPLNGSVTSSESTRQMIQELAFGLEQDEPSPEELARLWSSHVEGSSSSDDEEDDPSSLQDNTMSESFLVGSFAGSTIPDLDSDDDLDANHLSWSTLMECDNKKPISIHGVSTRRLAQHHLYLAGLCLASIRRLEEIGGPRRDVTSSNLEQVVDDTLGLQEGRPYPAE